MGSATTAARLAMANLAVDNVLSLAGGDAASMPSRVQL